MQAHLDLRKGSVSQTDIVAFLKEVANLGLFVYITELDVTDDNIRIRLENKTYRLDIYADRTEGVELPVPRLGEMTAKVTESLRSSINVILSRKKVILLRFSFREQEEMPAWNS